MSRRRRTPRRRALTVLGPLLLVAVLVAVGAIVLPLWRSVDSAPGGLTVRYRNDAPATGAVGRPWLEVINSSDETVALKDVTLRYYFTADGAAYSSNCVQTSLGCSNVTQKIGELAHPTDTASHYLQIGFSEGAGSLKPGGTSEAIGLRLFRLDGKALNQANDRSFDAGITHYAESKLVTAYHRGGRAWGDEPRDGSAAPEPGSPATGAAAPPAGVMFDSFRYSGPNDPVLAANGWQVRTGGGGPGISGTWSTAGVSFPADARAQGGQSMRLRVSTDGTRQSTRQSEVQNTGTGFFQGTIAARVHFSDKPAVGRDGDHINQSFFAISPSHTSKKYGEFDYEYMPNGGWGAPGPRLDTTSWRNTKWGEHDTHFETLDLRGWHTLMITAMDGKVTYSVDGRAVFTSDRTFLPREPLGVHFSAWLVDLPFTGSRDWDMRVNWLYHRADRAVPLPQVQKAVDGFYDSGTSYVNTLPRR